MASTTFPNNEHPGAIPLTVAAFTHVDQDGCSQFTLPDPTPAGPTGSATYAWTWKERPTGASATFSNAAVAQPTVTPDEAGGWVAVCAVTVDGQTVEFEHSVMVGRNGWVLYGGFDLDAQGSHDYLTTAAKNWAGDNGEALGTTYSCPGGAPGVVSLSAADGYRITGVNGDYTEITLDIAGMAGSGWTLGSEDEVWLAKRETLRTMGADFCQSTFRIKIDANNEFYAGLGNPTNKTYIFLTYGGASTWNWGSLSTSVGLCSAIHFDAYAGHLDVFRNTTLESPMDSAWDQFVHMWTGNATSGTTSLAVTTSAKIPSSYDPSSFTFSLFTGFNGNSELKADRLEIWVRRRAA